MSLFKRDRAVSTERIEGLQLGATDDKVEAIDRAEARRRELLLSQGNPWTTSNAFQLDAAYCAVVYMNDRLAEIMYMEAKKQDRKGRDVLPPDIEQFAYELSQLARVRLEFIRGGLVDGDIQFNDEQRRYLNIENNMPSFPVYPAGYSYDQPYDRDPKRGIVTFGFVEVLNRAAKELQGHVSSFAKTMEPWQNGLPHPYSMVIEVIRNSMVYPAADHSERADQLLNGTGGSIDPATLSAAYNYAVMAYVSAGNGYIACFCPASLGEGWEPPQ